MRIGAALALIAVGAILRFALTTVVTHGVYLHTVGDILMGVGVVGLILWLFVWGPWARNRSSSSRRYTSVQRDGTNAQPGSYVQEERRYEDQYPN
jgi:hypothetical protein